MISRKRRASAARAASPRISRSPLSLVVARRTPDSSVASAPLARRQFSFRSAATRSRSACSARSARSRAEAADWGGLAERCAVDPGPAGSAAGPDAGLCDTARASTRGSASGQAAEGWRRMRRSGTSAGGGRSLKTRRPLASVHTQAAPETLLVPEEGVGCARLRGTPLRSAPARPTSRKVRMSAMSRSVALCPRQGPSQGHR